MKTRYVRLIEKLPGVAFLRETALRYYEQHLLEEVKEMGNIPRHLAVILDGNRRFAREAGLSEFEGHRLGAKKFREVLEWCDQLGINFITVYAFSTENFKRPKKEIKYLMRSFAKGFRKIAASKGVKKHKIRIRAIGDLGRLPREVREAIKDAEGATKTHDKYFLNIAIGYGGRVELAQAVQRICRRIEKGKLKSADVNEQVIGGHLYTTGLPDPDLIIRTSGEERLSSFLLWQSAYSELYFCEANWPAFRRIDFLRAVRNYQGRERRFGK